MMKEYGKNRTLPKGIYLDYKSRYIVRAFRNKINYYVGTYESLERAIEKRDKFYERLDKKNK